MTKFCESCHTANLDRAKYCRGCAGRFSGIRTAANVAAGALPEERSPRVARMPRFAQPAAVSMAWSMPQMQTPMPAPGPERWPAMATTSDLFVVPRTIEKRELARPLALPGGLDVPVVLLLMVVLLSIAGFVFWYWDRTVEPRLALSPRAPSTYLQPSELQAPLIQEQATNSPSAAAPVAVPPMVG